MADYQIFECMNTKENFSVFFFLFIYLLLPYPTKDLWSLYKYFDKRQPFPSSYNQASKNIFRRESTYIFYNSVTQNLECKIL